MHKDMTPQLCLPLQKITIHGNTGTKNFEIIQIAHIKMISCPNACPEDTQGSEGTSPLVLNFSGR
jgi:hypothetical protein